MRIQTTDHNCGIFATYNALSVMGIRPSVRRIAKLTNTTNNGTNEFGIMQALTGYGLYPKQFYIKSKSDLRSKLEKTTKHVGDDNTPFYINYPIIACVDNYRHWIVIAGVIQDRFIVLDSNNTKANKAQNGLHFMSFQALVDRWRMDGVFYGIVTGE